MEGFLGDTPIVVKNISSYNIANSFIGRIV